MQKMSQFYQNVSKQLHLDCEQFCPGPKFWESGEDSCCSPVISRRDCAVQALPAPTVPRRSSSSGGMGTGKGGAKLGVAVFRLPCSVMSGSSCQRDTSTPQPSSSPPNRTCAGQNPSFFCLELFPAWVDSVGLGQCRSTEP